MGKETTVDYIDDLNITYPEAGDTLSETDDHIRYVKKALKATFPNGPGGSGLDGPVLSTLAELNNVDGSTAATATVVAAGDRVVYNDAGTMKQVDVDDIDTYFSQTTKALTNKTATTQSAGDNSTKLATTAYADAAVAALGAESLTLLDEPLTIGTITYGSWTTVDMSVLYAAAAGATKAILRVKVMATEGGGTGNADTYVNIRPAGTSVAYSTVAPSLAAWASSDSGNENIDMNDVMVNLDANSDFDYIANRKSSYSTVINYAAIYLVGYYS